MWKRRKSVGCRCSLERYKVTDKRDGTYEVHFKSVPSLECMLSVTIGGHHLEGSPVEVKVAKTLDIKKNIQRKIKIGGACYAVACESDGMLYAANHTKEILVIQGRSNDKKI